MSINEKTIDYLLKRVYKLETELESAKGDKMDSDYNANASARCAADYLKRLYAIRDLVRKGMGENGHISICKGSPVYLQLTDLLEIKEDN